MNILVVVAHPDDESLWIGGTLSFLAKRKEVDVDIIADKNRTLYPKDFKIDNPYNTYEYRGLPPGPINNPGFLAIKAAINPDATEYLYFVLKATNSREHIFNTNEKDHEKSRKEYLKSKNK